MSHIKEVRYTSRSITPPTRRTRSRSSSKGRSRSRSQDSGGARNPGNNLYVTGLSSRVTSSDLEKYFSKEGKVLDCNVVLDPRTKESRGFAFVTMENLHDANKCVKYLDRSVLEGRLITVEKAKRKRGRTPTPGKYCGPREARGHGSRRSRSRSCSPSRRHKRDRSRSRGRSRSPYARESRIKHRNRSLSVASEGKARSD